MSVSPEIRLSHTLPELRRDLIREWRILTDQVNALSATLVVGSPAAVSFETVSKNLEAADAVLNYTGTQLTSIVYTVVAGTITKTFNYTGTQLDSIVLSGDTPGGIDLTKTLTYTGTDLTGITYS